ncbi:AMP-binding protein [Bacteroidales bacterium OttesenSCG-928-K03]|nr:AMP-binding protein [Odoribacter sp. OttesenSCG-928-L07]MDL2239565.1 AMP-binding protein [Bacteroidales bacterium OttesenSCG-928-L14]MDL2240947.1 AMP-binding protein [Bacteroidales bacterium OttesenSCG-928-K22]MDL2242349.1 AMP-binding protein [Bacteroidales bacterium OttesenSCG-928-K03]
MLKQSEKLALSYKDTDITYSQLLQYSLAYAEAFAKNDNVERICIIGENSLEWVYAFYGALRTNAIAIPIDVQSTPDEIAYILKDCNPDIIFSSEEKKESLSIIVNEEKLTAKLITAKDIDVSEVHTLPIIDFLIEDIEKTALIIYTSGTTGTSKGVMLSYKNILFNLNAVCKQVPIITEERTMMILLPLHHVFPLLGSLMAPLYIGESIFIAEGMNSESIIKTLNKGKINLIIGVPRLYALLAKGVMDKINAKLITKIIYKIAAGLQIRGLSNMLFSSVHKKFGGHLKYLVSGGAALSIETGKIFKTLGFEILDGYGMTETSPMISFTHPEKWKLGYAGLPLDGAEVKSIDGEICVKGDNVMQGYYNRPEETAEVIIDGWLHTGDLGIIDKYGVKLTGRIKEIIVTSNGKNIIPEELERKFMSMSPYTKEIGVFMHEGILQALIIPEMEEIRETSLGDINSLIKQDIINFNSSVSQYKRIKQYHIISTELPKNRLGKLQRFKFADLIEVVEDNTVESDSGKSEQYILLRNFIAKETGKTPKANDHFEIDLGMDSLTRIALMAFVETNFGVSLNEKDIEVLDTLAKMSAFVEESNNTINLQNEDLSWKDILSSDIPPIKLPRAGALNSFLMGICRGLINICYKFKSTGKENIPEETCIFVSNHQSMLDGVVLFTQLKKQVRKKTYFFAKNKHFKNFFMKFLANRNNIILMDINSNLRESLQKLMYVLSNNKNVAIYPEGTRSKTGMNDFKDLFAILSTELKIPVVPIVTKGTNVAVIKSFLPRFGTRVSIEFLEPIYPQVNESYIQMREKVQKLISDKLEEK